MVSRGSVLSRVPSCSLAAGRVAWRTFPSAQATERTLNYLWLGSGASLPVPRREHRARQSAHRVEPLFERRASRAHSQPFRVVDNATLRCSELGGQERTSLVLARRPQTRRWARVVKPVERGRHANQAGLASRFSLALFSGCRSLFSTIVPTHLFSLRRLADFWLLAPPTRSSPGTRPRRRPTFSRPSFRTSSPSRPLLSPRCT